MNSFKEALEFRHACKIFDKNKKIPDSDFEFILEAGRLSPSSFGLEHTHFLVIQNQNIREILKKTAWDQEQVTTSSHFVILLSRKPEFFVENSEYLDRSFSRRANGDKQKLEAVKSGFRSFIDNDLKPDLTNWSKMQSYIASANMMTAAAILGIDSCPIEGFNYNKMHEALVKNVPSFDDSSYNIAYAIAFGYRLNPQSTKLRWPLSELTTFVK